MYKQHSREENDYSIMVRSTLIAMRSSFVACVEGLSQLIGKVGSSSPLISVIPEIILYYSAAKSQIQTIKNEYNRIAESHSETASATLHEIQAQFRKVIDAMDQSLERLRAAGNL
ncbi:MAG: hypothetical protein QXI37_01450 [Thermoprotei archaeon]